MLEIRDSNSNDKDTSKGKNKPIATRRLDSPLARVGEFNPPGSNNWGYFLTVDHQAAFGSSAGPVSTFLQISNATFRDVQALDADTHLSRSIQLMKSQKSDWKIATGESAGDILSLSCFLNNEAFVVMYTRYHFDGTEWLAYQRREPGLWESDEPFPPRSAFP
jgi:hypothetical protein